MTNYGGIAMNQDIFAGRCRQLRGQVKEFWGGLTRDTLLAADGARDQHAGKIRQRRGVAKETAARQLKDFFDRNRDWRLLNR